MLRLLGDRARRDETALHAFAFKDAELDFARAVAARGNLWIYRVDQRAFGGDFVVVDVSSPDRARRPVVAIDLKRGGRLREGRPGVSMSRAARAVREIVEEGVVAADVAADVAYLVGDARLVLDGLGGVLRRRRR